MMAVIWLETAVPVKHALTMKILGQQHSINVRKVLWTCAELGVVPETEDWGGATRATDDPRFLSVNPKGLVPVLVEDDLVLTESNAICRYLVAREARYDLLPKEPAKRALVEAWMDWQATDLNAAWRGAFMGRVRQHPDFSDATLQSRSVNAWNDAMLYLDAQLERSGAYVCGEEFSLADIVLALSTNRWHLTPLKRPTLHAVEAWMQRLSSRKGFTAHCKNGIP